MYWRQWVAAIGVGSALGYYVTEIGYSVSRGLFAAGIGIILLRWGLATIGRTRYWLQRGTRGIHSQRCPNCHQNRHRVSGDWILTCKQCGWRPGIPILRWITHNVPAIQLRRSASLSGLLIVLVLMFAILSGWALPVTSLNETTIGTSQTAQSGLNTTEVERLVWVYTNEKRQQYGLNPVSYDSQIASLARHHSRNMAEHDYIGHKEPNGETGEERYNHLCDFTGTGYTFGENVFVAWYNQPMIAWQTNETVSLRSEEEVARYLVNGWMNSTDHRQNILNEDWRRLGVGIHIRDDGKVFGSQSFC